MSEPDLNEIGRRCNTDKGELHSYLDVYRQLFAGRWEEPLRLLEIGIRYGGSLRMWREAFPRALITGVDNDDRHLWQEVLGCTALVMDVTDREAAELSFADRIYDVIIDDGSHVIADQVFALCWLWSKLARGGVYVIEDVQPENVRYFEVFHPLVLDRRKVKGVADDILVILRKPS